MEAKPINLTIANRLYSSSNTEWLRI